MINLILLLPIFKATTMKGACMQLFKKCMDTALKIPYFIKKRRFPTPWTPLLKSISNAKTILKHFGRGLHGVGDLLFFIKRGIYRTVSMHFSNNCMHAPYIVATVQHQIEAKKPRMIRYIWPQIC